MLVSMSSFNRLRRQNFKQYVLKSPSDNFSHFGTSATFKDLMRIHTKNSDGPLAILKARIWHLALHESHRNKYYKDRILSKYSPKDVLCIIHDKMDDGKTMLHVFAHKNKRVDKYEWFPISIVGMIALWCELYALCSWYVPIRCQNHYHLHYEGALSTWSSACLL